MTAEHFSLTTRILADPGVVPVERIAAAYAQGRIGTATALRGFFGQEEPAREEYRRLILKLVAKYLTSLARMAERSNSFSQLEEAAVRRVDPALAHHLTRTRHGRGLTVELRQHPQGNLLSPRIFTALQVARLSLENSI